VMRITAKDLLDLKVIDEIIKEPLGGAHNDLAETAANIKTVLNKYLRHYESKNCREIADERYLKFRNMGVYKDFESNSVDKPKKAKRKSRKDKGEK